MSDDQPTVGWAEPWPRVPDDDVAWLVFVGSLDPEALKREHMRVHGDLADERPGSAKSNADMEAHAYIAADTRRELTETDKRERAERYRAFAEADADRLIAEAEVRRQARERDEQRRQRIDRGVHDLDNADIEAARRRHHHRNGHAA